MLTLPDIAAQIDPYGSLLDAIMHKFQHFQFGLALGPPAIMTGTGQPFTT